VVAALDDAEVLWPAKVLAGLDVELDDPPHAASSRTSDPIPAAAHPLLRIVSLSPCRMTGPGSVGPVGAY